MRTVHTYLMAKNTDEEKEYRLGISETDDPSDIDLEDDDATELYGAYRTLVNEVARRVLDNLKLGQPAYVVVVTNESDDWVAVKRAEKVKQTKSVNVDLGNLFGDNDEVTPAFGSATGTEG